MAVVYGTDGERLWIVPLKCASTSIFNSAKLKGISRDEAMGMRERFTIAAIRDPESRVQSSLSTVLRTMDCAQDVWRNSLDDPHISPQYKLFEGFEIDFFLHFETLARDWKELQVIFSLPDLCHLNKRQPSLKAIRFEEFAHLYTKDLELCKRNY